MALLLLLAAGLVWRYSPASMQSLKQAIANSKATDWPTLASAIISALSIPLLFIVAFVFVVLVIDIFVYYAMYRKPILPILFGRQLPSVPKKTEADARKLATLQSAVGLAVADAQKLLRQPLQKWPSGNAFIQAGFKYMSKQFGVVEKAFKRADDDKIRASLMFVGWSGEDESDEAGELMFLQSGDRRPLKLSQSIAGRTVLQTSGDAVVIANTKNVFYEPDFDADNPLQDYRALLCIPIICHFPDELKAKPYFVLSIDSTLEEAFAEPFVTAARSISACIGLVGQRFLEAIYQEYVNEMAQAQPAPQGGADQSSGEP